MNHLQQKVSVKNAYILLTVLIIIFGLRLPSARVTVIDWDETAYWTVVQDIARGGMLYQTTWDIKGPLLYFISKIIFRDNTVWIPPLVYGLFFQKFGGLASNAELFMMLPAIIAAYYFVCYIQHEKPSFSTMFLCGFFSAVAVLIKLTSFFIIIMFPLCLLFKKFQSSEYPFKMFFTDSCFYNIRLD